MTTNTYRAIQVSEPRKFEIVQRSVIPPPQGKVRIRVEACGVCHSDAATVEGGFPGLTYPRVPGHEVVGKIDAIGEDVLDWSIGQRVGVGFLGGHCGRCQPCRSGDFVNCQKQNLSGLTEDGGYAEMMIADQNGLVAVPEELTSAEAAPLLCAGVTTYNALRNSMARPGDVVAIHGIGGLGHLGVQFARHMGFHVLAIARGKDKESLAVKLGAHRYVNSQVEDPVSVLKSIGGARVLLTTVSNSKSVSPLINALSHRGRLIVVGAGSDPIEIKPAQLIFGSRSVEGALTGSPLDTENTLAFSALEGIRPMIEIVPLERAADAYGRMIRNEARFRIVLLTGQ